MKYATNFVKKISLSIIGLILLLNSPDILAQETVTWQACEGTTNCNKKELPQDGTVTDPDDGIVRNTYEAPTSYNCSGLPGLPIISRVLWDPNQNRWELDIDFGGAGDGTAYETVFFNEFASAPNPPALGTGNWIIHPDGLFATDEDCTGMTCFNGDGTQTSISGSAPEIEVSANNTNITDGDMAANISAVTDFGDVCVNTCTVSIIYTISNTGTGTAAMTITTPTLSGSSDFSITTGVTGTTIPAGGSTTFTVTFDPSSANMATTTINIPNNDDDEHPFNFLIKGTGIQSSISLAISGSDNKNENSGNMISYLFMRTDCNSGVLTVNFAIAGTASDGNPDTQDFNVSGGTAVSGDFTVQTGGTFNITYGNTIANQGTIEIPMGGTTAELEIIPNSDAIIEDEETVVVKVLAP